MFNDYRIDVETALRGVPVFAVNEAVNVLREVRERNSAAYIVGNGGSAATASHFANDLVKMCSLRAFSIPDMVPLVTAYGNDNNDEWRTMFRAPFAKLMLPQDVLIAISCSGNSINVCEAAAQIARSTTQKNIIALVGADRMCQLAILADVVIDVPFRDIRVQEDCHMVICHAIVGALK